MRLKEAGEVSQGWTTPGWAEEFPVHLEQWSPTVMVLNRRMTGSQPVCKQWPGKVAPEEGSYSGLWTDYGGIGQGWWPWYCGKVLK